MSGASLKAVVILAAVGLARTQVTAQELRRLGAFGQRAVSVSEDGRVVTIQDFASSPIAGMRWEDGVGEDIGNLGGFGGATPIAASATGAVIVGNSAPPTLPHPAAARSAGKTGT